MHFSLFYMYIVCDSSFFLPCSLLSLIVVHYARDWYIDVVTGCLVGGMYSTCTVHEQETLMCRSVCTVLKYMYIMNMNSERAILSTPPPLPE